MKVLNLFVVTLLWTTKMCFGQSQPQAQAGLDIGVGGNGMGWSPSVLYHEEVGLSRISWLQGVIGIRTWGLYAGSSDLKFQNQSVNQQILKYQNLSANGLSLVAGINIQISKVDLGANTDFFGVVYGSARSAFYPGSPAVPGEGAAYYNTRISTSPTVLNTLPLFFHRQTGQSEIYARIRIARSIGLKVGYLYGRISYATRDIDDKKVILDYGQQRFSKTYGMPYAALCYSFSD